MDVPPAQTVPMPPPSKPPTVPQVSPQIAKTPAAPPKQPDSFNRYGKIWTTSDDVEHPLKLNNHFPAVSEIKIPSQDELNDRDKLEQLSMLSDEQIRSQLEQWPPYTKMKLGDQGQMLIRIQQFKEARTKIAMDKAHDLGIYDSLTPDQKTHFEEAYWEKRQQMDHDEVKQMEPIVKAWEQQLDEDLFRKFSSTTSTAMIQPAANKPPQVTAAPGGPTTDTTHPLAQSQH